MAEPISMSEEEFERRLSETMYAGEASGLEQAARLLLAQSAELFSSKRDDEAKLMRRASDDMADMGKQKRSIQREYAE